MICSLHQLRSNFCSVNFSVFTDYKTRRVKRWHPSGVPRTRFRVSLSWLGIRVIQAKMTEKWGGIQGKYDLV